MTDRYGLIGYPLGHSFSRKYFTEKFTSDSIDAVYELHQLEDINLINRLLGEPHIKGLNVTIPHKQKVIAFLDELSPEARAINAVNVIKVDHIDGKLKLTGYNTDAPAFEHELNDFWKKPPGNAMILGTGGASAAVAYILQKNGWKFTFVSRYDKNRQDVIIYSDITPEIMAATQLIINTTPLGMVPNTDTLPPILYDSLTTDHYIFDLVYNPDITLFMKEAGKRGAYTRNGMGMLYRQADLAWYIWQE